MIILLLLFTSCNQNEHKKIVIGVMPDVNSVPFIVAYEQGEFDAQGLDVELRLFMSAVERDTALQAGELDGCVSDILSAVFTIQGGYDVKVTSITDGDYVLLASKDSNIYRPQEFKDSEIGLSNNTIIEYVVDSVLTKNNLHTREYKKVAIPKIPIRMEMLENDRINGACLPQPLATLAVNKGARIIASSKQAGLAPSVMVFYSKAITEKKEEMKKIYQVYNQVVEQINHNPDDYIDMIIEKAKFPAGIKDTIQLPYYKKAVLPSKQDVQSVIDWMEEKELLKQRLQYDRIVAKGLLE